MRKKILAILLSLAFICVIYVNCSFAQYPQLISSTYTTCNPSSPYCRSISPGTQPPIDPNSARYSGSAFPSAMSFQYGTGSMMGMYGMYGMYGSGIGSGMSGLLGSATGSPTPSGLYGMYGMYGLGSSSGMLGLSGSVAGSTISGGMMGLYGMYGMYGGGSGIGSGFAPTIPTYPYVGSSGGMMGLYGMYGMYGMGSSTGSGSIFNFKAIEPPYPVYGNILNTSVPPAL